MNIFKKKHITEILIWFVGLAVTSLLVFGFVLDFEDTPSTTTICKEIGHGKYHYLDKLLKPDSNLREIRFNDNSEPVYTEQQKELNEIYKKILKLVTN